VLGLVANPEDRSDFRRRWITVEEAARIKKVHVNSVYKAIATGKVRSEEIGAKRYLVDAESLAEWIVAGHKPKGYRHQ
jgi:excisionase family DNA binding protein